MSDFLHFRKKDGFTFWRDLDLVQEGGTAPREFAGHWYWVGKGGWVQFHKKVTWSIIQYHTNENYSKDLAIPALSLPSWPLVTFLWGSVCCCCCCCFQCYETITINDLSTLGFFSFAVFGRAPVFSISTEINDRSPPQQGTCRKRYRPQSCLGTMPTRLLYLFLDMLGILSLKNKSITFCLLMTLLRLGALGQK